jgi:hypothetical protein
MAQHRGIGCVLVAAILMVPAGSHAQQVRSSRLKELLPTRARPAIASASAGCIPDYTALKPGAAYSVTGSTAVVPVTFSRIERSEDNKYRLGASIDIGYGYTWYTGSGTFTKSDAPSDAGTMTVEPDMFYGLAVNPGIRNSASDLEGSFSATAFAGIRSIALSAGYDVLAKSPVFGLSVRVDAFKFGRGSGARFSCVRPAF